ncbi:tetratricopeptide repeat protein [Ekhidna sp. To15]|uniref:tetratricopeptide repeat protein n=1 Tax=Ekhidna sp. To15 TaxID=3395267 RepID=UPI003F520531
MSLRLLTITVLCHLASTINAQTGIDSLWRVVEQTNDAIIKVDALNKIAYDLRSVNPDSTLLIGSQSEAIAMANNYQLGIADAKMRRAIAHTNLGNYYRALQLYLESQSIFDKLNVPDRVASCLNNIGRLYNFIGDHDRALEYYQKASIGFAELKDTREGNILNNIGYIYKLAGDYPLALEYLRKAWIKAHEVNDPGRSIYPIYNIGSTYMLMDELDSAMKYLDSSMNLAYHLRNQYILSLTKIDLGQLYLKMNKLHEAEYAFQEAYNVASAAGMRSELRDAARHLSSMYEVQNNLKQALQFHKIYQATNDSLFNRDLARRIALQEAEYEYQQLQVQQEIEQQNQKLKQEKELANAIGTRNTLIIGFLAMSAISYLMFFNFKRKRKANDALRALNKQIERQAAELQHANHEIIVMNNNLEKIVNKRTEELKLRNQQLKEYLSSNSHIVRAPLARILGLVDLYDPKDPVNLPFINESLQDSATELDNALRSINEKLSDGSVD